MFGFLPFYIQYYTLESGLRDLERQFGSICRKVAKSVVEKNHKNEKTETFPIGVKNVSS